MIKILYKLILFIYSVFIIFIFSINFNFLRFKENLLLRVYYSIKINFIYFAFYLIYLLVYYKYINKKSWFIFLNQLFLIPLHIFSLQFH